MFIVSLLFISNFTIASRHNDIDEPTIDQQWYTLRELSNRIPYQSCQPERVTSYLPFGKDKKTQEALDNSIFSIIFGSGDQEECLRCLIDSDKPAYEHTCTQHTNQAPTFQTPSIALQKEMEHLEQLVDESNVKHLEIQAAMISIRKRLDDNKNSSNK